MRLLRVYPPLIRAYINLSIEYRAQTLIWILSSVLPIIMMFVWLTLAENGPVGGFTRIDFISYYLAVIVARRMVGVWLLWDYASDIRLGTLSPQLLRPLNPVHFHFARWAFANKPIQLVIVLPPIALAAWLLGASYDLRPLTLLWVLVALYAGVVIEFFAQMMIGSLAFWITEATAVGSVWFYIRALLSGWVVPLALFPPFVTELSFYLPFRYMLSFPVEIVTGTLTAAEILQGMLIGYGWGALLWLGYTVLWRRGLKQYGAVGA